MRRRIISVSLATTVMGLVIISGMSASGQRAPAKLLDQRIKATHKAGHIPLRLEHPLCRLQDSDWRRAGARS